MRIVLQAYFSNDICRASISSLAAYRPDKAEVSYMHSTDTLLTTEMRL